MSLDERANLFNRMVLDDAMDEYGLIRHSLTTPDRKPIPDDQLEDVRKNTEQRKRWVRSGIPTPERRRMPCMKTPTMSVTATCGSSVALVGYEDRKRPG